MLERTMQGNEKKKKRIVDHLYVCRCKIWYTAEGKWYRSIATQTCTATCAQQRKNDAGPSEPTQIKGEQKCGSSVEGPRQRTKWWRRANTKNDLGVVVKERKKHPNKRRPKAPQSKMALANHYNYHQKAQARAVVIACLCYQIPALQSQTVEGNTGRGIWGHPTNVISTI